jgi:NADH-ubiquinone oxidoreductase chain 3
MTSATFFFIFIPILAIILLGVNLIFAPHNPYGEKDSVFECGFHSFLGQNRTQFTISFFIFALLFLLFDLEILLVYPFIVSAYTNDIYGLAIMLLFFLILTFGFSFELGKNALKIDSRQMSTLFKNNFSIFGRVQAKYFFNPKKIKPNTVSNMFVAGIFIILSYLIKPYEINIMVYIHILDNMPEKYVLYGTLFWPILIIIPRLFLKGLIEHIFEVLDFSLSSIKLFKLYLLKKLKIIYSLY